MTSFERAYDYLILKLRGSKRERGDYERIKS